jgi:4,5-DOPA dioxygenase extradiol
MKINKTPLIFIGHWSPMNAIEVNAFTESWKEIGLSIEKPRTILVLSAHWITEWKTLMSTTKNPAMIYDMYGFPPELYTTEYSPPGNPELANEIMKELQITHKDDLFLEDEVRWLDHGIWSTLIHMFPDADIPIITLSLDYQQSPTWHYNLGKTLSKFRKEWVLIMGSGNIVHNLWMIDWSWMSTWYSWAHEFDTRIALDIENRDINDILESLSWKTARLSHPSYDHLLPLFPLLGAGDEWDRPIFYTPEIVMWSLSMRSIVWI